MHMYERKLHCTRTDSLQCAPERIACQTLPPDYPSLCEEENYTDENHDYGKDDDEYNEIIMKVSAKVQTWTP